MTQRKGRHWWWLQSSGVPVPPSALRRWDSEAAHKLNRMDRQRAKREIRETE